MKQNLSHARGMSHTFNLNYTNQDTMLISYSMCSYRVLNAWVRNHYPACLSIYQVNYSLWCMQVELVETVSGWKFISNPSLMNVPLQLTCHRLDRCVGRREKQSLYFSNGKEQTSLFVQTLDKSPDKFRN